MTETTEKPAIHFEDLALGQLFTTGVMELTRDSIIAFAQDYDPQPMHLSDEGAADTIFGSLVASGWQITAITMRLMVDSNALGTTPLIGAEISNIRFAQPAYPGMMLTAKAEITEMIPSNHPKRGFVVMDGTTLDQNTGETLLTQRWRMLVPKRPG